MLLGALQPVYGGSGLYILGNGNTEGKDVVRNPKCSGVEQPKEPRDSFAVVLRWHPEIVLVVDRHSLTRAWTTARLLLPELSSEDLAFRTMLQKEVDELRTGR